MPPKNQTGLDLFIQFKTLPDITQTILENLVEIG